MFSHITPKPYVDQYVLQNLERLQKESENIKNKTFTHRIFDQYLGEFINKNILPRPLWDLIKEYYKESIASRYLVCPLSGTPLLDPAAINNNPDFPEIFFDRETLDAAIKRGELKHLGIRHLNLPDYYYISRVAAITKYFSNPDLTTISSLDEFQSNEMRGLLGGGDIKNFKNINIFDKLFSVLQEAKSNKRNFIDWLDVFEEFGRTPIAKINDIPKDTFLTFTHGNLFGDAVFGFLLYKSTSLNMYPEKFGPTFFSKLLPELFFLYIMTGNIFKLARNLFTGKDKKQTNKERLLCKGYCVSVVITYLLLDEPWYIKISRLPWIAEQICALDQLLQKTPKISFPAALLTLGATVSTGIFQYSSLSRNRSWLQNLTPLCILPVLELPIQMCGSSKLVEDIEKLIENPRKIQQRSKDELGFEQSFIPNFYSKTYRILIPLIFGLISVMDEDPKLMIAVCFLLNLVNTSFYSSLNYTPKLFKTTSEVDKEEVVTNGLVKKFL